MRTETQATPHRIEFGMKSVLRPCLVFIAWAAAHSLLATDSSKSAALALAGPTRRNALYRVGYNAFAIISLAAAWAYIHRLPDRPLYRIPYPLRSLTQTTRLALLIILVKGATEIGLGPFSGLTELLRYLRQRPVPPEPQAQGPVFDRGELKTSGPFLYVRHPLNAAAAAIALLIPDMTDVRLTVALFTALYSYIGSHFEERRLLCVYGDEYRRYIASGVPFFVPRLPSIIG